MQSDYINANHVQVAEAGRSYILTQGPKASTVSHFWSMVWQQGTTAIVMLCKTVEGGICKCANYWPGDTSTDPNSKPKDVDVYETDLRIQLLKATRDKESDARIRTLKIKHVPSDESRIVTQYHFLDWPDFGVPDTPDAFLSFLKQIGVNNPSLPGRPNVIHCSAGIGRSGTYCLVDSCLEVVSRTKKPVTEEQILSMLLSMRRQRMGLVQTADQLRFAFLSLADAMSTMDFDEGFFARPKHDRLIIVSPAKSPSCQDAGSLSKQPVTNGSSSRCPKRNDADELSDLPEDGAEENGMPNRHALSNQVSTGHGSLGRKRSTDFVNDVAMSSNSEHNKMSESTGTSDRSPSTPEKLESLAKRKRDC